MFSRVLRRPVWKDRQLCEVCGCIFNNFVLKRDCGSLVKVLYPYNNKVFRIQKRYSSSYSFEHTTVKVMPPIINSEGLSPEEIFNKYLNDNRIVIFSKSYCGYCRRVKTLLKSLHVEFTAVELDNLDNGNDIQDVIQQKAGISTVPAVFANGKFIGDSSEVARKHEAGELLPLLFKRDHTYDYDLIVIGGGSGGLAASKEASKLGAKVAVCDFVEPTPQGTTWGLGGTCVNVGCIPKKLMHHAAILNHDLADSKEYGWNTPDTITHDWARMIENIQNHIGSLNWGYRVTLRKKEVDYLNAFATFVDNNTIQTVDKKGKVKTITADKFLVAVGGRPNYPEIPGAKEYGITSDDLFSLPYKPGKTLLVGASYISLECAGFLATLGYDTTVMVRSILLRGFDQQMAELVGEHMKANGVKFIRGAVPTKVEQIEEGQPGRLKVTAQTTQGEVIEEEFNTVLFAIGRSAFTEELKLDKLGVNMAKNGKIIVNSAEQSSVANIYAVGDVIEGGLELTPVAIQAGKLLARRLFGGSSDLTDYINVPTTVFTPLEYGCCGLSEEAAIEKYGEDDIEVYHSNLWPLEYTVAHRPENDCYAKLICVRSLNEKVVGFHCLMPNAGEVTQGFAIALKLNATKGDFDNLIGIHPTCAEVFTTLGISKRSGVDVASQGC